MPERPAAAEPGPWSWLRGLGWNEGPTGSRTLSLTWRLRALAAFALLGCVGIFVLARSLALQPMLDPAAAGTAIGSDVVGFQLQGSLPPGVAEPPLDKARIVDAAWLNQPLTRWYSDTSNARRTIEAQVKTAALLSSSGWVSFVHADGLHSTRQVGARGWQGLGIVFWPLVAAALLLYLMASAVWLARPHQRNALYLLLAWSQAAQVVGLAVAALPGLSPAHGVLAQALPVIAIAELPPRRSWCRPWVSTRDDCHSSGCGSPASGLAWRPGPAGSWPLVRYRASLACRPCCSRWRWPLPGGPTRAGARSAIRTP